MTVQPVPHDGEQRSSAAAAPPFSVEPGIEASQALINNAFMDGNPSTFAQNNLVNGACP